MGTNQTGLIKWRFRCVYEKKRKGGFRYSPSTASYQPVHAKVAHMVGVGRQSIVRQGKYIENCDRNSILRGKEDLVGKIGEPIEFAKRIGREHEYYKVMLSPKRGDLLDMKAFVRNTVRGVEAEIGQEIDYAAGIHKPAEPNSAGVENLHAHLIVRGGYGRGANWFKAKFREAAALEATRQIELGVGDRVKGLEITKEHHIEIHMRSDKKHD